MPRTLLLAVLAATLLAGVVPAGAQLDPEPRANLELGVEGPLRGHGTVSGYGFFLWNRPHFLDEDYYLRVILAPTYARGEWVIDRWPASGHAIGLGAAGGVFPYNFDEFRQGSHVPEESFWGHGGEVALSYYRRVFLADVLPIEGQVQLRPQYVVYQRSDSTDSAFRLPADTAIYNGRVGVRLGGVPPELLPDLALELSAWYEASYRADADPYGLPDDPQTLEHLTQRVWGRAGGILKLPAGHSVRAFVTGGTSGATDALSSFRLGSALPFRSEFPLVLHGYYLDEVFARRFWLFNAGYRLPVWPGSRRVALELSFDYAQVEYVARHELPRHGLRGVGADLVVSLTSRMTLMIGYGYGFDAPRGEDFGGHEAHTLLEYRF
jgi:hypothetical protein